MKKPKRKKQRSLADQMKQRGRARFVGRVEEIREFRQTLQALKKGDEQNLDIKRVFRNEN